MKGGFPLYKYEVVSIDISEKREGFSLDQDYSAIIHQKAKEGWRFIQLSNLSNLAKSQRRIDLIFEKKE